MQHIGLWHMVYLTLKNLYVQPVELYGYPHHNGALEFLGVFPGGKIRSLSCFAAHPQQFKLHKCKST